MGGWGGGYRVAETALRWERSGTLACAEDGGTHTRRRSPNVIPASTLGGGSGGRIERRGNCEKRSERRTKTEWRCVKCLCREILAFSFAKTKRRFPTMDSAFVFSVWCLSTDMESNELMLEGFWYDASCFMLSLSGCQGTTHPCGRLKYVCGEEEGCCSKRTGFANAHMFVRIKKNTSAHESRGQ